MNNPVNPSTETEGVIRFQLDWQRQPLAETLDLSALEQYRQLMLQHQLIGQDPHRYLGYGFGNISQRTDNGFIISGTQTGHMPKLGRDGWAEVTACDPLTGEVTARGPVKPSSEAMSHAIYYQLEQSVNAVIHVHCPQIFHAAKKLGLPATPQGVEYGTIEMVQALQQCFTEHTQQHELAHIAVMSGHEDGVICCGKNLPDTSRLLLQTLARAG